MTSKQHRLDRDPKHDTALSPAVPARSGPERGSRVHGHALACLWLCGLFCVLTGCADFERGEATPETDAGAQPDANADSGSAPNLTFASDVYPLLISGCMSCHTNGGSAGRTALVFSGNPSDDHEAAVAFVDTSTPAQSRLLTKAAGQAHSGGAIYAETSDEYATMLAWVESGAQP